jgi:hypothetical protein
LVVVVIAGMAQAQDIDTAIGAGISPKHETVLDQMAPDELRDFHKFYSAKDSPKRRELAETFVREHPQS